MRYTVGWTESAKADLADIWIKAANRSAVADASDRIDLELAVDPITKGEDYYGDRILVDEPLAVVFVVIEQDRFVRVVGVRARA